ncbi:hypothetical protein DT019_03245 [Streptomyces sp. SDr-06]|uniref:hypothetical protein n=1 Tax=Streptomyces sp. SDr-06 TaxID=2267702 RepID=UPI000DE9506E|nr:hypothetical protein [Streptomyces sp. SDr-06]RCH70520.1 hypothetical protein DT019_03245 [Streptomyces sp. SDr-06]
MTVLDVAGWAMDAAPYIPAVAITGVLAAAVYAAWHGTRRIRQRRAARRIADHPLVTRKPATPAQRDSNPERQQLEQLYQMPAWEEDHR